MFFFSSIVPVPGLVCGHTHTHQTTIFCLFLVHIFIDHPLFMVSFLFFHPSHYFLLTSYTVTYPPPHPISGSKPFTPHIPTRPSKDRGDVRPLRLSSGSRVQRRTTSHKETILHQFGQFKLYSEKFSR